MPGGGSRARIAAWSCRAPRPRQGLLCRIGSASCPWVPPFRCAIAHGEALRDTGTGRSFPLTRYRADETRCAADRSAPVAGQRTAGRPISPAALLDGTGEAVPALASAGKDFRGAGWGQVPCNAPKLLWHSQGMSLRNSKALDRHRPSAGAAQDDCGHSQPRAGSVLFSHRGQGCPEVDSVRRTQAGRARDLSSLPRRTERRWINRPRRSATG